MSILKLFFLLSVCVLGAALAILNERAVHFDFYFGSVDWPLSVIIAGTLSVGALVGLLASLAMTLEVRRDNSKLRREAKLARREISHLRTLDRQDH